MMVLQHLRCLHKTARIRNACVLASGLPGRKKSCFAGKRCVFVMSKRPHARPARQVLTLFAENRVVPLNRRTWQTSNPAVALGMTLLELVVVMAVTGILLAIAVPSFVAMTQTNRVASEVNALSGDFQFARAEAIKEGLPVTICTSSNGSSCSTSVSWNGGWIVFSDVNGTQTVDAGDTVLRRQIAWKNSDTLANDSGLAALTYSRDGFAIALPGTVTWKLKTQPLNAAASRCMAVNIAGRQQVQKTGVGNCS